MEAKGEANGGRIFPVVQGNEPDRSPDGTMILFRTAGTYDIAVVSVDPTTGTVGTPTVIVATALDQEFRPTWSPDGSKIAFARHLAGTSGEAIYVRDLATGNETQLPVAGSGYDFDPEWSPDGTRIAYDDKYSIYVVNVDGSNLAQLTNPNSQCGVRFPTWSPDGTAIVFSSCGIKKLDLATLVVTTITSFGQNPDWSP